MFSVYEMKYSRFNVSNHYAEGNDDASTKSRE